jgi:DNA-binding IscR family transcriptional regulator
VNNLPEVKICGARLDRAAVRILREIPGVTIEHKVDAGDRPDIVIQAGDVTAVVEVKVQRATNAASAEQLIAYARHLPGRPHLILIAQSTTADARDRLTAAGIGIIDAAGTIRLDLPGLFIWRDPPPGASGKDVTNGGPKLAGKAGLATQALLRTPERHWTIQELAQEAGVSTGLVHRVVARLEREDLVDAKGVGPHKTRRVTKPGPLLELWAEEMRDRGVRQLRAFRLNRDSRAMGTAISQDLNDAGISHAITGAAAALRLAPFVTAVTVTDVWVAEEHDLEALTRAARAETVTEGNNVIFRSARDDVPLAFRERHDGTWLADPLRVFLDVRNDPRRGREQAAHLRTEVIGF